MRRIGRQTLTLVRRQVTGRDRYERDITTETRHDVRGCTLQPVAPPAEVLASADQVTARWISRWPVTEVTEAATAVDGVIGPDGTEFEIDGNPQTWPGLGGQGHHVRMYLTTRKG